LVAKFHSTRSKSSLVQKSSSNESIVEFFLNILEKILLEMKENRAMYYINLDIEKLCTIEKNAEDGSQIEQLLEVINSVHTGESLVCYMGSRRVANLIDRWRESPECKNHNDFEIIMFIDNKIKKFIYFVLICSVNTSKGAQNHKFTSTYEMVRALLPSLIVKGSKFHFPNRYIELTKQTQLIHMVTPTLTEFFEIPFGI